MTLSKPIPFEGRTSLSNNDGCVIALSERKCSYMAPPFVWLQWPSLQLVAMIKQPLPAPVR
jgi:hypothetical protein